MQVTHPNRKVGIVTFNNEIAMIGDGNSNPIIIAGDKLNKYDEVLNLA